MITLEQIYIYFFILFFFIFFFLTLQNFINIHVIDLENIQRNFFKRKRENL
jgi:hypothetical protein